MPFYEYQCSRCGHHHEELQRVTDRPLRKCPECGRSSLARLMSAPVFRLKGGGWYETDFKSGQEARRNLAGDQHAPEGKPADQKADDAKSGATPAAEPKPATGLDTKPAADAPRNGQRTRIPSPARRSKATAPRVQRRGVKTARRPGRLKP